MGDTRDTFSAEESRYRILVENNPHGIQEIDTQGIILFANRKHHEMWGLEPGELVGQNIAKFNVPGEQRDELPGYLEYLLQEQPEPTVYTSDILRADGEVRIIEVNWNYQRDECGAVTGFLSVLTDVTEQVRTKDDLMAQQRQIQQLVEERTSALLDSEERLKLVLDGSQLGYWDWDIERDTVQRNDRWAEMLGYTLEEFESTGQRWTDLIHPDERDQARNSIQDHIAGKTPSHRLEYRILTKEGTYKWILDCARVVERDSAGKPVRMCGTHSDIDDQRKAEEELSESKHQTEMAILGADLGTWETRYDRQTVSYNVRIAELLGYSLEELNSEFGNHQTFRSLFHPSELKSFIDAWAVHEAGTESLVQFEHRFKHKSGHYIWVLNRGQIMERDADGKPLRASGTYLDITERKLAEQALQTSEQRMNLALQSAELGIWEWDGRTDELRLSENIASIGEGFPKGFDSHPATWLEPLPANVLLNEVHPDDLPRKGVAWLAHAKGETNAYEFEYRRRNSKGEWVWILDRGRVTERDSNGRAIRSIGTSMNVTRRKEAELELTESRCRMELAL